MLKVLDTLVFVEAEVEHWFLAVWDRVQGSCTLERVIGNCLTGSYVFPSNL